MGQVDQITLVAPGKTLTLQSLLQLLECGGGGEDPVPRVQHQLPAQPLNIIDSPYLQLQRPSLYRYGEVVLLPLFHVAQGTGKPLGEGEVMQGL